MSDLKRLGMHVCDLGCGSKWEVCRWAAGGQTVSPKWNTDLATTELTERNKGRGKKGKKDETDLGMEVRSRVPQHDKR